jgi:AcrR family transcriptional regulator
MSVTAPPTLRELAARYSPTQRRTIDAALGLFGTHGVGGTSFQMIADELGVTKAAIYHQFQRKEAIAIAAIEVYLQPLEDAVAVAEASGRSDETREALLTALIDSVVTRRASAGVFQGDPAFFRLLGEHPPSIRMWTRLFRMLLGDDADDQARVRASALAGILGTVAFPFVVEVGDDTLRDELLRICRPIVFGTP